ncbi:MAG: LapA family protein [Gemmatimonadota bacterium]|nr:MAG: LapA family protein [Gemmatimonadota bacterium]
MARWKLGAVALIVIVAIIVVAQNTQSVETKVLFVTVVMPRAVLLLITLLVGFALGVLAVGRMSRRPGPKGGP